MRGDRQYFRAAEIAALTGMSIRTIRRWIREETLPSARGSHRSKGGAYCTSRREPRSL